MKVYIKENQLCLEGNCISDSFFLEWIYDLLVNASCKVNKIPSGTVMIPIVKDSKRIISEEDL